MFSSALTSRLRHAGFLDASRALDMLSEPALAPFLIQTWIDDFGAVADPDQCLLGLIRLCEENARAARDGGVGSLAGDNDVLARVLSEPQSRRALLAVLGLSTALTDHLCTHPSTIRVFLKRPSLGMSSWEKERAGFLKAVNADPSVTMPTSTCDLVEGTNALRAYYHKRICALAAEDLTSPNTCEILDKVCVCISDIVAGALEAGLALVRSHIEGADKVGLAVIAMGKTGAREVNYVSDVDVIYVARSLDSELDDTQMLRIATKMASALAKVVSAPASEPALWALDANLRPEGKDGPLVRTLDSHLEYYRRWAKNWEFQALLKARAIAGDMELGRCYVDETREFVWKAVEQENFVEESRAMRRRVETTIDTRESTRQLKLGKGGLRDIEFTVQLLQLVHGRTDKSLRAPSTLEAIAALSAGGYVSRTDAERLEFDYRFLRVLEHRIQLQRLRRSHLVPTDERELRRVGRAMGRVDIRNAGDMEQVWQKMRREVRQLHQDIYYRPLLPLTARLSADDIALTDTAAQERLGAIGYRDPAGALRHIGVLTSGVSRAAAICRQLLPVMLGWFADAPDPDGGLLAFRILFEKAGTNSYFMRTLRDGGAAAQHLCHVLATSRFLAQQIPDLPEAVSWLANTDLLHAPSRAELEAELASMVGRRSVPTDISQAGRYLRRRELVRAALAQALGVSDDEAARKAVSLAADIAVHGALTAALTQVCPAADSGNSALVDVHVFALGRMGGQEMCYSSDADLLIVYDARPDVDSERVHEQGLAIASATMRFLAEIGSEPPLAVDVNLRPEGSAGPVARSLASYQEYYERWAATWEHQALVRARPCAGDTDLAARFCAMIDTFRYPHGGLTDRQLREIRMMKARVESERIPHGVSSERHIKLGRGGLSDVEWTIQILQLDRAWEYPPLRVTGTLEGLRAASECGLLTDEDSHQLIEAWSAASRLRDMNFLATAKSGNTVDIVPSSSDNLGRVAFLQGKDTSARREVEEEYLRVTRRARHVVEREFYGNESQGG
ncbi:MAG: bifunctional [Actinomycetaceae bacterium]|nr:bifunctional [glutamine synthetase] adenylyltransferase/[glutamine synthetase]-adenylyl-L-tyrosine phosphorylase [Actinomycetaceae bacterium]